MLQEGHPILSILDCKSFDKIHIASDAMHNLAI